MCGKESKCNHIWHFFQMMCYFIYFFDNGFSIVLFCFFKVFFIIVLLLCVYDVGKLNGIIHKTRLSDSLLQERRANSPPTTINCKTKGAPKSFSTARQHLHICTPLHQLSGLLCLSESFDLCVCLYLVYCRQNARQTPTGKMRRDDRVRLEIWLKYCV